MSFPDSLDTFVTPSAGDPLASSNGASSTAIIGALNTAALALETEVLQRTASVMNSTDVYSDLAGQLLHSADAVSDVAGTWSVSGSYQPPAPVVATVATSGAVTSGTHRYMVTINSVYGEDIIGVTSSTLTNSGTNSNTAIILGITVLGNDSVPNPILSYNLYRTKAGVTPASASDWWLVAANLNAPVGGVSSTALTYTDSVADTSLSSTHPPSGYPFLDTTNKTTGSGSVQAKLTLGGTSARLSVDFVAPITVAGRNAVTMDVLLTDEQGANSKDGTLRFDGAGLHGGPAAG
jgi:hypothetical protein